MGRSPASLEPLHLVVLSRSAKNREELAREFDALRSDFPDLRISQIDMSQLFTVDRRSQVVVLDLHDWQPSDEMILSDLRRHGYNGAVVILTDRMAEATSASYREQNVFFFDRSKGQEQLNGVTRRMLLGSLIAARKHPRHPTDETAQVLVDGRRSMVDCKVLNLSAGGAFLQLDVGSSVKVGDMLTLKIHLSQVGRVHLVRGRVAWTRLPGFGVEFLVPSV